jgi:hypothetical protein
MRSSDILLKIENLVDEMGFAFTEAKRTRTVKAFRKLRTITLEIEKLQMLASQLQAFETPEEENHG